MLFEDTGELLPDGCVLAPRLASPLVVAAFGPWMPSGDVGQYVYRSDPRSLATSQASIGRSPSLSGLIVTSESSTSPFASPARYRRRVLEPDQQAILAT